MVPTFPDTNRSILLNLVHPQRIRKLVPPSVYMLRKSFLLFISDQTLLGSQVALV